VLGQAHTPHRRPWVGVALAAAVVAVVAVSAAGASHGGTGSLRARDSAIVAKSRAAVLDLYALDRRLGAAQARLATLEKQELALAAQRNVLARQLAVAGKSTRIAQAQLNTLLRRLYEQGNVEPIDVVFGATSLDDAMSGLDNLDTTARANRAVLQRLATARRQLLRVRKTLSSRASALTAARREAEATAAALLHTRTARSAYVASLAAERRLTESEIARVVAESRAATQRSVSLTPTPGAHLVVTPFSVSGQGQLTVSATGYAIHGRTASGLPTGYGVVAVDPSVIPLGTHMTIPGYGDAVAADVGPAIVGARLDLWFPTLAQARAWGRRTVTITLH
jgi:peptidoglycan DL-endopeptidase CwlO